MSDPTFTDPPATPSRGSATFSSQVAAFLAWLASFAGQVNAVVQWMRSRVIDASNSATAAATAQAGAVAARVQSEAIRDDALSASDAPLWTAKTYAMGDAVISPLDFKTYRDKVGGPSATDPSLDRVRWASIEAATLASIAQVKGITMVDACIDVSPNPSLAVQMATSWFAEAGPMPTRKIVIAESANIIILDGDDPNLPVWKTIPKNSVSGYISDGYGQNISSIASENGVIVVGLIQLSTSDAGTYGGGLIFDFGNDTTEKLGGKFTAFSKSGKKSGITSDQSGYTAGGGRHLINGRVNSVAMTVLPDAPIDPVSVLQVPTIAVATDGGVSIIDGPAGVGTVVDIVHSTATFISTVDFRRTDGALCYTTDGPSQGRFRLVRHKLPVTDLALESPWIVGQSDELYPMYSTGSYTGTSLPLSGNLSNMGSSDWNGLADAGQNQLSLISPNPADPTKGMLAVITSTYNTGWMASGCLGALLCSTDTSSLVGSGELVTNGTFDTDTDWTKGTGWTISGGAAVGVSGAATFIQQSFLPPLTTGQRYVVTFTISGVTGSGVIPHLRGTVGTQITTNGTHSVTMVAGGSASYDVGIFKLSNTNVTVDNISVKLADADRSVKNKGLIVNDTITRTPVATGAQLVGYGGFSATNYLEQPYNPDLDFGTGDFCIMGWVFLNANVNDVILSRNSTAPNRFKIDTVLGKIRVIAGGATEGSVPIGDQRWHFVCVKREAGQIYIFVDGALDVVGADNGDVSSENSLFIGINESLGQAWAGNLAILRIGNTAPSADQIRKIYHDERRMFQPGAQVTLGGTSDAVTALAHDPVTDLLHVGTSGGMSDFSGLARVKHDTDPVTTKIAAHSGMIVRQ